MTFTMTHQASNAWERRAMREASSMDRRWLNMAEAVAEGRNPFGVRAHITTPTELAAALDEQALLERLPEILARLGVSFDQLVSWLNRPTCGRQIASEPKDLGLRTITYELMRPVVTAKSEREFNYTCAAAERVLRALWGTPR